MDMHRLPYDAGPEQKLETCLKCADNSLSMLADYGLDAIDLRGIVGPEMLRRIDDALPPASVDLFNFEFDGQPFGRICLVDVVLAQKIAEFSGLSPQDRLAWRQYVRSSLVSYSGSTRRAQAWRPLLQHAVPRALQCGPAAIYRPVERLEAVLVQDAGRLAELS
jgi:hypothetical protein